MKPTNKKLYNNTKSGSARAEFTGRVGLPEPVINTRTIPPAVELSTKPNANAASSEPITPPIAYHKRGGNIRVHTPQKESTPLDKRSASASALHIGGGNPSRAPLTITGALVELTDYTKIDSLFDSAIKCSKLTYILMGFRKSSDTRGLFKIPAYERYCSDHGIIVLEKRDHVIVSFNAEHNGHVCHRIRDFVSGIQSDPCISPRTFSPEKVDKFVSSVLHLKNLQILSKLQDIISRFSRKQIVINLQEVSPSLYVILALNLKCHVTKLNNQHLVEIHQPYDTDEIEKMGVQKEYDTSAIKEYIKNLTERVPTVYDPAKHASRFEVNGSFMSIVHVPVSSVKVSTENSGIDFGIDMNSLPDSEEEYSKIVATSNNLPANQSHFVKSRPVMTYSQICNIGSRLLDNGVMLGTFFVICRGIYLEDYKTINFHGHKKTKSSECLLDGIRHGKLDMVFDMFEHDFDSNREFEVVDKGIIIDTRIFEPLLTSFMETLSPVSCDINYVAGDFNMRNEEFNPYGLIDTATEPLNSRRCNNLDRILELDITCASHAPTIHFKNIIQESTKLNEDCEANVNP